jgi:hypothetical protein
MKTKVLESVKKREAILASPERVYLQKNDDQLMDANALSMAFDFTNLESVFEKKQVLKGKLILVDQRLRENDKENQTLMQMLTKMQKAKYSDDIETNQLFDKKDNLSNVVDEVSHIHLLENQRII